MSYDKPEVTEPAKIEFLSQQYKGGDCFIDVGAFAGFYSILMANLVGPAGFVLAIEPGPDNFKVLEDNLAHWCLHDNARAENCALSWFVGSLPLYLGLNSGMNSLVPGLRDRDSTAISNVRVKRMDDLEFNVPVNGVKIDVEGSDVHVLEGGRKTLSNHEFCYLAMDMHPSLGVDLKTVRSLIEGYGLTIVSWLESKNEVFAIRE